MVDIVGLDSNMDTVKGSTKGRFVSKIRRFLGREDAQRRGDSPNWSSSSSSSFSFVILRFHITIIICDSFSASDFLEQIPDRISSWSDQQHSFIGELISLAFFLCSFSKALVTDGDTIIFYSAYVLSSYFIRFLMGVSTNHTPQVNVHILTTILTTTITPTRSNSIPKFW